MAVIFWVCNRWGRQTGCIGDAVEAVWRDELNGEDSLTLVLAERALEKGDRVVWRDRFGEWHEHVANECADMHADGSLLFRYYCENSIAETTVDYIGELVAENATAAEALPRILANTRWEAGTVGNFGRKDFYWFNDSVQGALSHAIETWGGEFSTTVQVSGEGVSRRIFNLAQSRGADNGKLFTYGHDMTSVQRTVAADDVVTRLHVFGKATGLGDAEAGYTERLTFAEINGGKDYVEDASAKEVWGLPDGSGGTRHAEGVAVFDECDDEEELLELGRSDLAERSHPHVSYQAGVAALSDYGYEYDDARTGDTVWLRDRPLDLRLQGRVTSVTRYLVNESATVVELGDTVRSITDVVSRQRADLAWLRSRSGGWDAAAAANAAWLDAFVANLNEQMNATGGYVYWEQGVGITVYDAPRDQNPTMAIQLNGMGFRIANSKTSSGEWKWRTFGTGNGFVADEIVTGVLRCGNNVIDLVHGTITLVDGSITDSSGNYWKTGTGEFCLVQADTDRGIKFDAQGNLTVDATRLQVKNGSGGTLFEASEGSSTVTIGGFSVTATALYNGLASLTGYTRGVYLGTDGIATANGSDRMVMQDGRIYGYNGTSTLRGTIDPSARWAVPNANYNGVQIIGTDSSYSGIDLRADMITVKKSNSSSGESSKTVTGTQAYLHGIASATADGVTTLTPKKRTDTLVHGMVTGTGFADETPISVAAANHTHSYSQISGTPSLAAVATSGSYSDLSNKPTIPSAYTHPSYSTATAAAKKIGRDSTGHVVIGGSLTASDVGASAVQLNGTRKNTVNFALDGTVLNITFS